MIDLRNSEEENKYIQEIVDMQNQIEEFLKTHKLSELLDITAKLLDGEGL